MTQSEQNHQQIAQLISYSIFNKKFQKASKQLRSDSALDFTQIRESHVKAAHIKLVDFLEIQASPDQLSIIYNKVLDYLALCFSKSVYIKGPISASVVVNKAFPDQISLNNCYVTTQMPPNSKQVKEFAQLLKQTEPTSDNYRDAIFRTEYSMQKTSHAIIVCTDIDQLEKSVLNMSQFIVFKNQLQSPQQLYYHLHPKLSQYHKTSNFTLITSLIALHIQNLTAFPSFQFIPPEIFNLSVQSAETFQNLILSNVNLSPLQRLDDTFLQLQLLRIVLGMPPDPDRIRAPNFKFCAEVYRAPDGSFSEVSAEFLNGVIGKILEVSAALPEAYRRRIWGYLGTCVKVLQCGSGLVADGVVLTVPEDLSLITEEVLKEFVHKIMDPYADQ